MMDIRRILINIGALLIGLVIALFVISFTPSDKLEEEKAIMVVANKTIQQNGMTYMVIGQTYADSGPFVVNVTLDKAKLNYYKSLCE